MTFKEKLIILRKARGLTQDDFASAVGVSRQAVYKWESGQSYPEVAKLLEIKLLFNISIDDLLDDNFDIAMPEKKKKKRLPKAEVKKIEAEVKREIEAPAPVEEPVEVIEETKEAPVLEEATVEAAPVVDEKPEEAPAVTESAPAADEAQSEADEKKRGFFGRLFGRK